MSELDEEARYPITPEMRRDIVAKITERGWGEASRLARLFDVVPGTIQQIMNPAFSQSSKLVPILCGELGLDWVGYYLPHENQRRVLRALELLRKEAGDEVADRFAEEVERLSKRMTAEELVERQKRGASAEPLPPR